MPDYNLGTAQGRIVIDGSEAKRGFNVAEVAAGTFFGLVRDRLSDLDQLGTRLTQIGIGGSAGLGLAIKAAVGFQKGLSGVKAVSGATQVEMDKISQLALKLGKDTVFSAGDAVTAIEALVKAGISVADVLNGAASATVNLAAAGQIDLPQAAEIAANALNQFKLSGQDMPRVADLIAGAANASAIDVHDFGMSLSQAGAVAALTGIKFDGLSVAIAEMGQAGIKGSDAGTSLKTFLLNLIPTTDAQIAKFHELGLVSVNTTGAMAKLASNGIHPVSLRYNDVLSAVEKYIVQSGQAGAGTAKAARLATQYGQSLGVLQNEFFKTNGDVKSMKDIQDVLTTSTAGLTREQKLYTLNLLFGQDAIRAAAVLSDKGAAGYDKMAASMGKVTAASVAQTRLDNVAGSLEQLRGSLETAAITIGTVFLPAVKFIVDAMTSIVNVFDGAPPALQTFIGVMLGLGASMTLFTGIVIKLGFFLGPLLARMLGLTVLRSVFSIFATGFNVFRGGATAAEALAASAGRFGQVFERLGRVGQFLFGVLTKIPGALTAIRAVAAFAFGPWGIAIAIVVAGLVLLYKNFAPFRNLVNGVARTIQSYLIVALAAARQALDFLAAKAQQFGAFFVASILPALRAVGAMLVGQFMAAFRQISAVVVSQLLPAFSQLADTFMTQVVPALQQLWSALYPVLRIVAIVAAVIIGVLLVALFQLGRVLIQYVLPVLIQIFGVVLVVAIRTIGIVVSIIVIFISLVVRLAAVIITVLVVAITFLINLIKGTAVGAFNLFMAVVTTTFNIIKAIVLGVIGIIGAFIGAFIKGLSTDWNAFWGVFGQVFVAAWDLVKAIVTLYVTIIYALIYQFLVLVKNTWTAIWNGFVAIVSYVWNAVYSVTAAILGRVLTGVMVIIGLISSFLQREWNFIKLITGAAWRLIHAYIVNPISAAYSFVAGVVSAIFGRVSAGWNHVTSFTSTAWNKLAGFVRGGVSAAYNEAVKIKNRIVAFFANAGTWLKDAGIRLMQGLADGITGALKKVTGAIKGVTDKIRGFLPGSPIVEGPLKQHGWNDGRPGSMLMDMLIEGMMSKRGEIAQAMSATLTQANAAPLSRATVSGAAQAVGATPRVVQAGGPQVNNDIKVYVPNAMEPDQVGRHVAAQVGYRMASGVVAGAQPVTKAVRQ